MGWQVLSPFRGYANHQFTGGYDFRQIFYNFITRDFSIFIFKRLEIFVRCVTMFLQARYKKETSERYKCKRDGRDRKGIL